ncbi:T9SS type B sorting domain-containing protein [Chitinophaga rhizophila]|uniref:Gliding motility-associated C-terminal domain-containing protein n=1 Tax=Chitinophaga rhizophila TaxID=2866212 RepID=A0ABS7GAV2_9BACT|nr:gliding motility-associated C-terminal domain-containing protein [Chitinophaga rhizophila]MBW8684546.1 gliding motility-associated C-terminal domain-containing protein [Chitinophaga rhizophila]
MDLSFERGYDSATCYGALAIYGGITLTDTLELLWQSGPFYNVTWQRFTAEFTPHADYPYIVLGGDVRIACNNEFGIALALDNLSDTLRELPLVTYKVEPGCQGMSNGRITASATGSYPPFTFEWETVGRTGNVLDGISAGQYILVTQAANGVRVRDTIIVHDTEFNGNAAIEVKGCTGEALNKIILRTEGGVGPYEYLLSGSPTVKVSPEFDDLHAGTYNIIVKDAKGCLDTLENLLIPDPPLFTLDNTLITAMSCAGANDAQIAFAVNGGVPPYSYSLTGLMSQTDSVMYNLNGGVYRYHIADAQDCVLEGSVEVPAATHSCAIYVPNAFSPDGDGVNDIFRVKVFDKITDFRMSVFNRWGELLYTTNDIKAGWKGDYKGQPLPPGAYLWMTTYTDGRQQPVKQTGSVLIVK